MDKEEYLDLFKYILGFNDELKETILKQYGLKKNEIELQRQMDQRIKKLQNKHCDQDIPANKCKKAMTMKKFLKLRANNLAQEYAKKVGYVGNTRNRVNVSSKKDNNKMTLSTKSFSIIKA